MITLGIDLGVSSLGTAIVDTEKNEILHTGSYVFPDGEDKLKKNVSRREQRQSRRKYFRKRLRRVHLLRFLYQLSELNSSSPDDRYVPLSLEEINQWITWDKERKSAGRTFPDTPEMRAWFAINPYEVRAKALEEDITRREFGRLLYHMILRRGFQSSRKMSDEDAKAEEDKKSTKDKVNKIESAEQTQEEMGDRTLGQYLYSIAPKDGENYVERDKKPRNRYTLRRMYAEELERIWERQASHLGLDRLTIEGKSVKELLMGRIEQDSTTGKKLYKLNESIIFWQRPLRSQRHLINKCSLESRKMYDPKKKREYVQGPRVAAISHPISEFHRALQMLSNVRVEGSTLHQLGLLEEALKFLLIKSKSIKINVLLEKLGIGVPHNFESDQELPGCSTIAGITNLFSKKGKASLSFKYGETDKLYTDIWQKLDFYDDGDMLDANLRKYAKLHGLELSSDFSNKLSKFQLKEGYGSISLHALRNIIPFLLKGYNHTEAIFLGGVKNAFGPRYYYFEQEEQMWLDLLKIIRKPASRGEKIDNIINYLCNPDEQLAFEEKQLRLKLYHPTQSVQKIELGYRLGPIEELRNPIVQQGLWAVRRQVNALIDMMRERTGNPSFRFDRINIELAREVKASKKVKDRIIKQQRSNKEANTEAIKVLEELNVKPNNDNIVRYKLFKELQQRDGIARCPYTGKIIGLAELFDGSNYFQIEHIIPRSISLDNNFANKTLCDSNFNREKGNMTPWEFYSNNPGPDLWGASSWEEVSKRARQLLPIRKFRRFTSKRPAEEQREELPSKMLNDTAYMSVKAKEYLSTICDNVYSVNGHITSDLRYMWGLNQILSDPFLCEPGVVTEELVNSAGKEVYAILDNKFKVITQVFPKRAVIPNQKGDEVRRLVTVKDGKLWQGEQQDKQIECPPHLSVKNIIDEAILSYSSVRAIQFEPLFNSVPKELGMIRVSVALNKNGERISDSQIYLKGISEEQYPKEPGSYWLTMPINGEPSWELPSADPLISGKAIRVPGYISGNRFKSSIFETEVDNSVINQATHHNRTAFIRPVYASATFTKKRNQAPSTKENQILVTGKVHNGFFLIDDTTDSKLDVRESGLNEGAKYYAVLQYESLTAYSVYNQPPKAERGTMCIDGTLCQVERDKNLWGIELPKNRGDHRHHAIDALVVALCRREHVTQLSTYNAHRDEKAFVDNTDEPKFEKPWEAFWSDANKSINAILVRHKRPRINPLAEVTKKISKNGKSYISRGYAVRGQLHEATMYGRRMAPGQSDYRYHKRVELREITTVAKVNTVVDIAIRNEMLRILRENYGLDTSKAGNVPRNAFCDGEKTKLYLPNRRGGAPVPVKKVRVAATKKSTVRVKDINQYVEPGNNHHTLIYEAKDGSLKENTVTMWEVVDRLNRGEKMFQLPADGKRVLFVLMIGQMYIIGLSRKEIEDNLSNTTFLSKYLYRVQSLSMNDYKFRYVSASTIDNDDEMIRFRSLSAFSPKNDYIHRVVVDPVGNIQLKDD